MKEAGVDARKGTLHMLCGKMASGKSTLSRRLADAPGTVRLSEDDLLSALYGHEMESVADYVRCSARLREAIRPLVIDMLRAGISVVLDFPANTLAVRSWMRSLFEAAGADHRLHHIVAEDETCLLRLHKRNAEGEHPFAPTDAQFAAITRHFVPPRTDEGFNVAIHR